MPLVRGLQTRKASRVDGSHDDHAAAKDTHLAFHRVLQPGHRALVAQTAAQPVWHSVADQLTARNDPPRHAPSSLCCLLCTSSNPVIALQKAARHSLPIAEFKEHILSPQLVNSMTVGRAAGRLSLLAHHTLPH